MTIKYTDITGETIKIENVTNVADYENVFHIDANVIEGQHSKITLFKRNLIQITIINETNQ